LLLVIASCGGPDDPAACDQPGGCADPAVLEAVTTGAAADPGPRPLSVNPNMPPVLPGATASDTALFNAAMALFNTGFSVKGTLVTHVNGNHAFTGSGLGPRWNSFSCRECHGAPVMGGVSFKTNSQATLATGVGTDYGILAPAQQTPPFLTVNGSSLAARLKYKPDGTRDGQVHQLFTIAGRSDAPGCNIVQENWPAQVAANNVSVRITTPTFGAGLIEAITDAAILAGKQGDAATHTARAGLGIAGHENKLVDGTVGRFGWKAQTRTLNQFSADAFEHEMGVTSAAFPAPNDAAPSCNFKSGLDDKLLSTPAGQMKMTDLVAAGMRLSAPRPPIALSSSANNGQALFGSVGCALCHTPSFTTPTSKTAALSSKTVALYSDLLVHHMGAGLADDIIQGTAGPDEFRTAPLWGLGQRFYFLHDGRTSDLKAAILAHAGAAKGSWPASEANGVVTKFNALTESQKQDLLNFLRAL
jgi:CxxC motif-containing protein (DUF1111 family)